MFPVSHAPISPFEPCFSTMAYHYEEDVLLQQNQNLLVYQQQPFEAYESIVSDTVQEDASCREQADQDLNKKITCIAEKQMMVKKNSGKKDRHSKINTAHGPRDRRMRMSLQVAKQFFALQDILGFDKASKTVEWLLIQAKDEIIKLARGSPNSNQSCSNVVTPKKSASSNSGCEAVSTGNYDSNSGQKNERFDKGRKSVKKLAGKAAFLQVGKESRDKARERARERTREKMRSRRLDELSCCQQGCSMSIPFENTDRIHTLEELLPEVEEPSFIKQVDQDMTDDGPMVIMGNWSPSLVFNYLHNNGILEEHQSTGWQ